jgi:hypothetical protein
MKEKLKKILLQKLHAVERQRYDLANVVATRGIRGFIHLDYNQLKEDVLAYVKKMEVAPYTYKYAESRERPCLYASIYAVMIEGLYGTLRNRSNSELQEWADYLNSFQSPEDGLYYDSELLGPAYEHNTMWNEGWGKHHLMGHMIIALARLGVTPRYPLIYLEKYYDTDYLVEWMNKFDFTNDVWSSSNYFMNLYTVLEYARDYMDEKRADAAIKTMCDWLIARQNPDTGMWHTKSYSELSNLEKLNIVRAAYHFYPLFEYEGIRIPYPDKIVKFILPQQNSYGGWTVEEGNSGACEDIDAIDPLLRCAKYCPYEENNIAKAIKKSLVWQLACKNLDKGFSFYARSQQEYGGHNLTTSLRDESSMFATWFRSLCIAYEMNYLGINNGFEIGKFPGYEIPISL